MKSKIIIILLIVISITNLVRGQNNYWQSTNGPNSDRSFNSLLVTSEGNIFAASTGNGIYFFEANSNYWTPVNNGLTNPYVGGIIQYQNGPLYAACYSYDQYAGGIFYSGNLGNTWTEVKSNLPYLRCIAVSPGGVIMAGGADTVYVSTDEGNSWETRAYSSFGGSVTTIAFDKNENAYLGSVWKVFKSKDYGVSWNSVGSNFKEDYVSSLAVNSSNEVFAGTYRHGVQKLTESSIWNSIGLESKSAVSMVINKLDNIFVGRPNGVVVKYQGDTSWASTGNGLPTSFIWNLALDSNGYLYAGAENGIVFKSASPTTNVGGKSIANSSTFQLSQNYPNPFNPSTLINFTIPKESRVTLKVYSTIGKEIITLLDENKSAGNWNIKFETTDLPSGIYFYQINADKYVETKKMVLLK